MEISNTKIWTGKIDFVIKMFWKNKSLEFSELINTWTRPLGFSFLLQNNLPLSLSLSYWELKLDRKFLTVLAGPEQPLCDPPFEAPILVTQN